MYLVAVTYKEAPQVAISMPTFRAVWITKNVIICYQKEYLDTNLHKARREGMEGNS